MSSILLIVFVSVFVFLTHLKKLTLRNFDGWHFDPHFEALFRFPDVRDSNFKGSCQTGFDRKKGFLGLSNRSKKLTEE